VSENPFASSKEPMPRYAAPTGQVLVVVRGIIGGILGGVVGFFVFQWLARRGLYGMMIPGAGIGLGAGLAARGKSVLLGVICAAAAVGLSLVAEWAVFPFIKDKSLSFFLAHLYQLRPLTLIMMGLGSAFAFWLGQGR
jgi:hypothetical protein